MKNFKIIKAIFLPFALLIIQAVYAQAPLKMSYQAVIRTASNELIRSSIIRTKISILPNSPTATPVYSELQTQRTDYNGLLSLKIGEGEILLGEIEKINWGASSFYIKTETDPSGGNDFSLVSSVELMSVPYALYSLNSGNSSGMSVSDKNKLDNIGIGATANDSDANLKNRANHTGVQDISTITGLTSSLDTKMDKVLGKSLLDDSEITRISALSNYTHPVNHPASIITQDANNRFVTDAEKLTWNTKVDRVTGESLFADSEISRLSTVFNYTHPISHPASIITQDVNNRFVTDTEKLTWNAKVEKVTGKSLISDSEITRLSTLSNYMHPVNHTASIITQDVNNRFVTDAEKLTWNAKVEKVTGKSLISDSEISRLYTLSNYTHPVNHPASIITQDANNRFVTDADKITWNEKVDRETGKNLISDSEITRISGLSNYIHPVNHPASIITQDVNNRFVTDAEKTTWNANSGGLKTSDGLKISYELKKIGDNLGGISPLKISRSDITNNGQGDFENNTFFGKSAGISNYSSEIGKNNSFFGFNTGIVTIGSRNSFFGSSAGMFTTTGFQNVFVGQNAGMQNTTGGNNVFIGHYAGLQHTEGHYNVLVGAGAGSNITRGWASVIVGNESQNLNPTDWNSIVIGARVTGNGQNTVTLGNDEIIKTILKGTLSAKFLKVFDNNDAAKGALVEGDIYRTPTGDLKIVY
jgi:hypothetical protein